LNLKKKVISTWNKIHRSNKVLVLFHNHNSYSLTSIAAMSFTRSILFLVIITSHQAHEQKSITLHPFLEYCRAKNTCPLTSMLKTQVVDGEESFSLADKILSSTTQRLKTLDEVMTREHAYGPLSCNPPAIKVEFPKSFVNEEIPSQHGPFWNIWTYFVRIMHENQDIFLHYFLFYCFSCLLLKLVFFLYLVHHQMKLLPRRTSKVRNPDWETEEECPYCCCSCRYK